jgi:hypothetical protein
VDFFHAVDLDLGIGGQVLVQRILGAGFALVLGRGRLEGGAIPFFVDGVAFQAAAFLGQRLRRIGVDVGGSTGADEQERAEQSRAGIAVLRVIAAVFKEFV